MAHFITTYRYDQRPHSYNGWVAKDKESFIFSDGTFHPLVTQDIEEVILDIYLPSVNDPTKHNWWHGSPMAWDPPIIILNVRRVEMIIIWLRSSIHNWHVSIWGLPMCNFFICPYGNVVFVETKGGDKVVIIP